VVSLPPEAGLADSRLSLRCIADYVAPTAGVGFMFMMVGLYLMKYATDVLLIPPVAMGTIFFAARIWDAVSDPVAGYLSDRTRTSLGRRRPWLLASVVPVAAAFVVVWSPPAALSGAETVAWMAAGVIGFYAAMTIFIVPHLSLGAELSLDYHDRTRLYGARHIVWNVGSIAALAGMALLIAATSPGSRADPRAVANRMALLVSAITAASIVWAVIRLRERPEHLGRGARNSLGAYRDVLANPHARLLLVVILIESLGGATIVVLTPYVAQYIIGRPDLTPLFILVYMLATISFVPMWLPLSRRFGKKRLWMFSMLLTAAAFGGMFFLEEGSVALISVLAFLAGLAGSCGAIISPSIQADVIDWDEYHSGDRKEGSYFAAWTFVFKSATGITLMLTGYVLEFSGFVPNREQPESARLAIQGLYSIFPLACYLLGALIFSRFALGEAQHRRIRSELDARRLRPSADVEPPLASAGRDELP
jgi:GPH family glycoside/pentoside/hexuronide:cation symporter